MGKSKSADKVGVGHIDTVVSELFPYIESKLDILRKERNTASRLGILGETLRTAVAESSLSMWNGRPYLFTGKIYEPIRWEDLRNAVYEIMKFAKMDYSELNRYLQVAYTCMEMIKSKHMDIDNGIVVFSNGVLDIEESQFYPHDKKFFQVTMSDFEYDPMAQCPKWEKFLDQVLPMRSLQSVLQEYIGSIYIDRKRTKLEHMLILKGTGSNGKGVIFETITGIVGKENVTNFGLDALLGGSDQKKNVALMNGKRLNYCSEIQALSYAKNTDKLKTLISGEPTEARALYGENFMAHDIPLIIANCNKLPNLEDTSYGMQRRLIILPFEVTIPVELQDHSLPNKLVKEYSGIFNWLLEGRARFIAKGHKFTKCEAVRRTSEEFASLQNNCLKFMYEKKYFPVFESVANIVPYKMKMAMLYNEYLNWCAKNKEESKTLNGFSREITDAGYTRYRKSNGIFVNIYGETATKMLEEEQEQLEMFYASRASRSHRPLFINGKMYGKGDFNAAFYAHISRAWISTMRIKGKLDGCFKYQGATPVYDIDELVKRVDKLGAYVDEEKKISSLAQRESDRLDAVAFNEMMKSIHQPFRKWVFGMTCKSDREIFVPNEWEYSEEAAAVAIKEAAEINLKNIV